MVSKKHIFAILSLVLLIGGISVVLFVVGQRQDIRNRAASTGTTLRMNPSTISVKVRDTVTVAQTITTGTDKVAGVELHVTYNPLVLQAQSIKAGTFLPLVLTPGLVGNGKATITLGSAFPSPKTGSGILSSITFKAIAKGTVSVTYGLTTKVAAVGKPTNAVVGSTGVKVTVL